MALPVTTIAGVVPGPGGAPPRYGRLVCRLSAVGAVVDDGGVAQLVPAKVEARIAADGSVSIDLVPNDQILPPGTYWDTSIEVVPRSGDPYASPVKWVVPTVPPPGALNIAAVPRADVLEGVALALAVGWPQASAAAVAAAQAAAVLAQAAGGAHFAGPGATGIQGIWIGDTEPPDGTWIWAVPVGAATVVSISAGSADLRLLAAAPTVEVVVPGVIAVAAGSADLSLKTAAPTVAVVAAGVIAIAAGSADLSLKTAPPTVAIVASSIFLDTFDNASLDAAHWTSGAAAGGTVTETTKLALNSVGDPAKVAAVGYKTSFARAAARTLKVDVKFVDVLSDVRAVQIQQASSQPTLGTLAAAQNALIFLRLDDIGTVIGVNYRNAAGSYVAASADYSALATYGSPYRVIFESNATQWRIRLLTTNEGTIYKDFGWINWADTYNYNAAWPLWVVLGDEWTDYGEVDLEYTRFEDV